MDNKDIVIVLNELIETCKDGEYGFNVCAEHARSPDLQRVFAQRASGCADAARELQAEVARHGGSPESGGTASGALHRGWVAVRDKLSDMSDHAVLDECERGEDHALSRYRAALRDELPPTVRSLVEKQFQGAQRNHDQIKALRDSVPR